MTDNSNITSSVLLPDIACTSCASVIERYFNKQNGIRVVINFATKKAHFTYNQKLWNTKKIKKSMLKIGYEVTNFQTFSENLADSHTHNYEQHEVHMQKLHPSHFAKIKISELVQLIGGWLLLMPLLLIMIPNTPFFDDLRNPYLQLMLTIPIQFFCGYKFYGGIYRELIKQRWPGMHTLVVLSTTTAFLFSVYLIIIKNTEHLFFETAASIIMIVLLGDFISNVIQKKATNGLESLMSLTPKSILKLDVKNNQAQFINIEDVQLGDILIVRKGENIPTDGILVSQAALINESMLTGETQIINKIINQNLIGGTINVGNSLQMQATKIGKDTILANIIQAVADAQSQKPQLQKLADKISGWFTPLIILITIVVFIIRFFVIHDQLEVALSIAIATLIIACPCALGIATPLAVAVGVNKAAKIGIIYNKAAAFEKITKIDTVCFDKTGTLTTGKLVITKIYGEDKHISKACAMEKYSTHPLALAFINYAKTNNIINEITISNIKEIIGFGMKAKYENEALIISSLQNLQMANMKLSPFLKSWPQIPIGASQTLLALAINKEITNIFVLEDQLQPNALITIKKIQKQGIKVVLISGDNKIQTEAVANSLGISQYFANIKPIGKAEIIKKLQLAGQKVAFVGDGINDVIALEQADLAITMGSGSDIAKKIGDITITNNDISVVYKAIVLTKKTKNNIWINFLWAFSYNIVIIPLAAAGFFIPPLAALAMTCSDITVVGNSLIFKWKKYKY